MSHRLREQVVQLDDLDAASRILVMKSKWSRWAFCTHITSSKSRSSQFVGVSRSWPDPGAQTSTLRSVPTSEWTP